MKNKTFSVKKVFFISRKLFFFSFGFTLGEKKYIIIIWKMFFQEKISPGFRDQKPSEEVSPEPKSVSSTGNDFLL